MTEMGALAGSEYKHCCWFSEYVNLATCSRKTKGFHGIHKGEQKEHKS